MLDWIREWLKDADTKRQERVTAYVDGRLSAEERRQFDAQLAQDESLRAEVAALRAVKSELRALSPVRAPRNYTLDPAEYGAPEPAYGARAYPVLRLATAMTAVMFMVMVALTAFPSASQESAMLDAPAARVEETVVEQMVVTQIVEVVDESDVADDGDMAESEMADDSEPEVMAESANLIIEEVEGEVEEDAADEMEPVATIQLYAEPPPADSETAAVVEESADDSSRALATIAPEPTQFEVPEIILPTEVARSADLAVTATAGTMDNTATEPLNQVQPVTVEEVPSADWQQRLLILSAVLLVLLVGLTIFASRQRRV